MPILRNTSLRFNFASLSLGRLGAFLNMDRRRDKAGVLRLALFLPVWRRATRLSEISTVEVAKQQRHGGARYSAVLRLKQGGAIKFACSSRDEAMDVMVRISEFLKLE